MKKNLISILILILAAGLLVGCSSNNKDAGPTIKNPNDPLKVGSMTDDEGRVLGSLVQIFLENNGYKVESSVGTLAGNTVARDALKQDQLNIAIDYSGRGLMFIKDVDISQYQKDYETAFNTTKEADKENGIEWLTYAPYSNTDCIWVRRQWAEENNVKTIEDLANYFKNGGEGLVSAPYEYILLSPLGFPGWEKAYGLEVEEGVNLVSGITTDPAGALARGDQGIIAAHGFTTSGYIEAYDFLILEDPQEVAPIYSGSVVSNTKTIEKYPELATLFNDLFASIDRATITDLNKQLEVDGKSEQNIAEAYLKEKGFIK